MSHDHAGVPLFYQHEMLIMLKTLPENEGPDPSILAEVPVDSSLNLRPAVVARYDLRTLPNLRGHRFIQCHRSPLVTHAHLVVWIGRRLLLHVNLPFTHLVVANDCLRCSNAPQTEQE